MKRTLLTLALALPLTATGALAQTTDAEVDAPEPGMMTESFGRDWTTTLGAAMLAEDGTVRPPADIAALWDDMSEEDRLMNRRDCELFVGQSERSTEDRTDIAGTETDRSAEGSQADASDSMADDAGTDITPVEVSMEQMEEICATTSNLWGSETETSTD
jgi:hypothetical protein